MLLCCTHRLLLTLQTKQAQVRDNPLGNTATAKHDGKAVNLRAPQQSVDI